MFLVAGLGNPGREYEKNRHNAGFLFLDYLKMVNSQESYKNKDNYHYLKTVYHGQETVFIKPQTYMNLSGRAVINALSFFKIPVENFIVVYDDTALPFGKIRIRESGSAGGHNGLRNIEAMLGTKDYKRIRIGVSAPEHPSELKNFVLGDFSSSDLGVLERDVFPVIDQSLNVIINKSIKEAMNQFNGNSEK
jgi:PTH1 family peptidyl-tRNA hydrolase